MVAVPQNMKPSLLLVMVDTAMRDMLTQHLINKWEWAEVEVVASEEVDRKRLLLWALLVHACKKFWIVRSTNTK
jgi:hypothetical protein